MGKGEGTSHWHSALVIISGYIHPAWTTNDKTTHAMRAARQALADQEQEG